MHGSSVFPAEGMMPEAGEPVRPVTLPFQIGARSLWRVQRLLRPVPCSLDDVLAEALPPLGAAQADGYYVRSLPITQCDAIRARCRGWLFQPMQRYPRHYLPMAGLTFDDWWQGFSAKTRSTLSRKSRRLAEQAEGGFTVRACRTPQEIADFMAIAAPLSQRTYQDRLLDAGLPTGPDDVAQAIAAAARNDLRAFLLFLGDRAIAYLYLPVERDVLIYAYLGYDPDFLPYSPGTVLHVEAMRHLFAEGRFRHFDFTEGDGAHKALFGRASVPCADIVILRPTLQNRLILSALRQFNALVAWAKARMAGTSVLARLRRYARGMG